MFGIKTLFFLIIWKYMNRRISVDTKFSLCVIKLHNQHKFHKCYLPFDMFVFAYFFEKKSLIWIFRISPKKTFSLYHSSVIFINGWAFNSSFCKMFALFVFNSDIPEIFLHWTLEYNNTNRHKTLKNYSISTRNRTLEH